MDKYKWLDSEMVAPREMNSQDRQNQQKMANQLLNFLES